ncbi:hypothetical protein O181_013878 [Austropuccinia psidii MF-1]|uniref:Uncharacterized protein n=1 Tax=Austropuccinia psidii MF-1 TaxID=1389203 RepID=A0A9Q3C059_9BASI|nr:hypothetical protein [Austropuccinia psidii MF-1]
MKQMKYLLLTQRKKKGKRREQSSYTPGASKREPSFPKNLSPEDSPISPTPGPRVTSTPPTEPRSQNIPRRVFSLHLITPVHYRRKFQDRKYLLLRLKQNLTAQILMKK